MEHSNLNLSDSQIPGVSQSPSLLSEPPDIGKWFSSYVYESFVLDTCDNVGDSVYKQSECKEDRCPAEESNREKVNFGKFSSNEFAKCNSSTRDYKFENHSANEISGSSYSLSVPSEPPDIKNWFSSYVYESPVLDSDLRNLHREESPSETDDIVVGESNRKKEKNSVEFRKTIKTDGKKLANLFVESKRSFRDKELENHSITKDINMVEGNCNLSALNNLTSERNSEHKWKKRTLQNQDTSPTKDVKNSSLNDGVSQRKIQHTFPGRTCLIPLNFNRSWGSREKKSPSKLIDGRDFIEENTEAKGQMEGFDLPLSESKLNSIPVSVTSMRKSSHESADKENEGEEKIAENGFVSTKKNRGVKTKGGSSLEWPQQDSVDRRKNCRKVLAETTNFQHSNVLMVAGKWRCPQKSKPNLGPPLKQLRLEQWVHRV